MSDEPRTIFSYGQDAVDGVTKLPLPTASTDDDAMRRRQVDELRARDKDAFERIEEMTPDLDELLATAIQPPREWLDERSS